MAAETAAPETVSVFRKMSTPEADLTLKTRQLQPPIPGSNSSKYLSESLEKVREFQNAGYADAPHSVLEFTLDKGGYEELMSTAVNQEGSKGIDAVKINFEGLAGSSARNIGIPLSHLDKFNQIILGIKKVM